LYRLSVDRISHAFGYSCKTDDDLSRRNRKQVFNSREGGGTKTNKQGNRAEEEVQNLEPEACNNNHNNNTKNYSPESLWQILAESPARDVQSSTGGRVPTP
jgi:hypothetical protein